ncbi:MAG TPA: hypothetical protein ENI87_02015 [bacterium]|nr:hypothetical protein [bacterium]
MRRLAVLLATFALAGCTSTVMADPEVRFSPYMAVYKLRGKTKMQSADVNNPGQLQNNPYQQLRKFGHDRFREDVGYRLDVGDGFGGLRAEYYRLDMNTSRRGVLTSDWGQLLNGDRVYIDAEMDETRLGWTEPLADFTSEYRDEDVHIHFGAGALISNRQMTLRGSTDDNVRKQNVEFGGDTLYVSVRARAEWQQFTLDLDYAFAPEEFVLAGDLEDFSQDIEARLSYRIPGRDMRFFAGMRYVNYSASGQATGFRYDNQFEVTGYLLGVSVTF